MKANDEAEAEESKSVAPSTGRSPTPPVCGPVKDRVPRGGPVSRDLILHTLWPRMFAVFWRRHIVYTIWTTWWRPCRRCSFTSSQSRSCSWGCSSQPPWLKARASRISTTCGGCSCCISGKLGDIYMANAEICPKQYRDKSDLKTLILWLTIYINNKVSKTCKAEYIKILKHKNIFNFKISTWFLREYHYFKEIHAEVG